MSFSPSSESSWMMSFGVQAEIKLHCQIRALLVCFWRRLEKAWNKNQQLLNEYERKDHGKSIAPIKSDCKGRPRGLQ